MPASKHSKKNLSCKRENGYEKFSPAEAKKMEEISKSYMEFLGASKTEREAHDEAVKLLSAAGYRNLEDVIREGAQLKPGDKLYRSCSGKTLLALLIGKKPLEEGLHIIGGHTDAPRLDLKQNPLYENGELALLDTHYYGGIKKYQWVTIPLALHGVFVKPDGEKITVSIGEKEDEPVFYISDLLPHLGQDQAKKSLSEGITGEDLDIIAGSRPARDKNRKERIKYGVLELLAEKYGVTEADFMSAELEAVPAGKPREVGLDRSLIAGYGHDDRICAYAGLKALLDLDKIPEYAACVLLCDKEEIGSMGATGMQSNFFENTMSELCALQTGAAGELAVKRAMSRSRMLSADVNAAFDPLYPSVSEKKNAALINHGTCITKYTGARGKSQSSDASAEFAAEVRRIFDAGKVAWQTGELGKVDQGGGGTIAMEMARYGMDVIDCGVPLLSMHAPWELAAKFDFYMTWKGFLAFLTDARKQR
ncbi:MAG: aminopeptidase [Elusimicrobiales bacterium]|nr:aminopeptidase [Elusimicrobiales bacterium]